MRRVFVIRHGNTFANGAEARRIGCRTDIPLVASGHVQAQQLGAWFAAQPFAVTRLLSSPLMRARQTAHAIAAATGHHANGARDWLSEIDHGPDEGRPESEVIARLGVQAIADWDEHGVAPPGWMVDADKRIAGWRAFFAEKGEGVDLLVTSNGAARFALIAAGLPVTSLKLRTGAFGELELKGRAVRLVGWDIRP